MPQNRKIVSMGRGGVGKTSFVALMTRYFIEAGETPLLLIDADPDQNLAEMVLGLTLMEAGKNTISEILYDILDQGGSLTGIAPKDRIEGKIWGSGLYEGEAFDMMAIGTKWREGCYCLPNDVLKKLIPIMAENYRYTLIDSPAGLEHLNRRITPEVDDVFDLLDPSRKAFGHVARAHRIIKEIGIRYENIYLVGGYRFPEDLKDEAEKATRLRYLGTITYDEEMADYILRGRSLLDLPPDSPAYLSVKGIMKEAGY